MKAPTYIIKNSSIENYNDEEYTNHRKRLFEITKKNS
jgi:hypothetical protein